MTCLVTVVVRAVVPVAVHNRVPVLVLSLTLALGKTVPTLAVFRIHRLKLSVDPLGMTPAAFGTPDWVSNSLITYSPTALFVREVVRAELDTSGPAVSSLSKVLVMAELSLCRWYVADCAPETVGITHAVTASRNKVKRPDIIQYLHKWCPTTSTHFESGADGPTLDEHPS
jgi:hypothetical protein